jgi:hypothetical protein
VSLSLVPSPVKTCHDVFIFLLPSLPFGKLRGILDIDQSRIIDCQTTCTYIYDDDFFRKRLVAGRYPQKQISIKINFWLVVGGLLAMTANWIFNLPNTISQICRRRRVYMV